MQPGGAIKKFFHGVASMGRAVIQQGDHMAGYLTQQMAKKDRHFFALNVVFVELEVQRTMEAFRTDLNAGYGGNAFVTMPMVKDWCMSYRTPCFADRGNQEEARFVNEDEVGCQPCGVFFTRRQSDCFHSVIAASFRSMARRGSSSFSS